jgi:hypothetical protein
LTGLSSLKGGARQLEPGLGHFEQSLTLLRQPTLGHIKALFSEVSETCRGSHSLSRYLTIVTTALSQAGHSKVRLS